MWKFHASQLTLMPRKLEIFQLFLMWEALLVCFIFVLADIRGGQYDRIYNMQFTV